MIDYREVFRNKISSISTQTMKIFNEAEYYMDNIVTENITDLREFKGIYKTLNLHKSRIKGISVTFKLESLKSLIEKDFDIKLNELNRQKEDLMLSLSKDVENKIKQKQDILKMKNEEIRNKNQMLQDEIDSANSVFKELENKRQRLLDYSQDILEICSNYGIKTSDINISIQMFDVEELNNFYDQFYNFISIKAQRDKNIIRWLREKVNENTIVLLSIFLITLFLSFTPMLDVLAIFLILYLLYIQSIQESLVKKYTIMAGLAFNINPIELCEIKELSDDLKFKEISEEIDVDSDPELQVMFEDINSKMDMLDEESIKSERSRVLASFASNYTEMEKELDKELKLLENRRLDFVSKIDRKIEELNKREEYLKSKIKLLGTEFNEGYVLDTRFKLGIDPDTLIYETVDIGMRNIIFNESNDKELLDAFIKVMLANFYCNVRPGFADVTVYDPNGLGRSMAGFYDPDLEQLFNISKNSLDVILKELQEYTNKVLLLTKGQSINEYNREAAKIGKTCLNYKLLLILSQPKTVEENEALKSFIEYSPDLGVLVWMVANTKFPNTVTFRKPFEGINKMIDINRHEFPIQVIGNFKKAYNDLKSPSLLWKDFKDIAIPDSKIWTYNADEFIELDPGFEDGDPSKYKGYTLGNTGDIHALCVGGTGAGKSVYINNLIANIATKYHPNSVELWLVDFKGSEFSFYLKNPKVGQEYILPHIAACLCTSDPDYSVSLFKALRDQADQRYKFLIKEGFKNMYEFNKAMRKQGTPERCLRRILLIADEFQVIFEKTGPKAQEQLKKDITQIAKVARACGIHLFFCSQSMKGTISDDILSQFTLRFGLRCPMEVSQSVMGTRFSGDIREKNGYLYVRSIDDKKLELQKRYRTPFIPDGDLRDRINLLAKRAEDEGYTREKEAIQYDESTLHYVNEIDNLYSNELNDVMTDSLFILGERMVYSEKGRRANIFLSRENNKHIFSVFSNTKDIVMFFNSIQENLKHNGKHKAIYNSKVEDLTYLLHLDEIIQDDNRIFNDESQTPASLISIFQDILNKRKQVENPDSLAPLYIFLIGWDKAMGFGIDNNYKLSEQYSILLQTCGAYHMHFIFMCTEQAEIPKSIIKSSHFRIAGKCDDKSSTSLLDSDAAYKTYEQEDGYMFLFNNGSVERLKIYQSELTRKLKEKSLII